MLDGRLKIRKTKHTKLWSDHVDHCATVAEVNGDQ